MPRITPISFAKFDKFLRFVGCVYVSQKGSHRKYVREDIKRPIIIPFHSTIDIPVFIIKNTLRTLGVSNETYLDIAGRM